MIYYSISFLAFQNGELKAAGNLLTANETPLTLNSLKQRARDFVVKEYQLSEQNLSIVLPSFKKISEDYYNELTA